MKIQKLKPPFFYINSIFVHILRSIFYIAYESKTVPLSHALFYVSFLVFRIENNEDECTLAQRKQLVPIISLRSR